MANQNGNDDPFSLDPNFEGALDRLSQTDPKRVRNANDAGTPKIARTDDRQGELGLEVIAFNGDSEIGTVDNLTLDPDRNTIWANVEQMSKLFGRNAKTINDHIRDVFKEGELDEPSVIKK